MIYLSRASSRPRQERPSPHVLGINDLKPAAADVLGSVRGKSREEEGRQKCHVPIFSNDGANHKAVGPLNSDKTACLINVL